MKTLNKIKEELAKEQGAYDINHLLFLYNDQEWVLDRVAERYADQFRQPWIPVRES